MRELEFLPDWYPQMLRRKRRVSMEASLLILIVAGLAAWTILARRNVMAAETSLDSLQMQLQQVQTEQKVLETQLTLRKELQARADKGDIQQSAVQKILYDNPKTFYAL